MVSKFARTFNFERLLMNLWTETKRHVIPAVKYFYKYSTRLTLFIVQKIIKTRQDKTYNIQFDEKEKNSREVLFVSRLY